MTSQTFLPKTNHSAPKAYFMFLLRQNWPALVVNTIILLLINVVFLSMALTEELDHISTNEYQNIVDIATSMRIVNIVVTSMLAILWGCSAPSARNPCRINKRKNTADPEWIGGVCLLDVLSLRHVKPDRKIITWRTPRPWSHAAREP